MFSIKRFFILVIAAVIIVSTATAQTSSRREMSVEETYLQESIELMIIRETARAYNREQKFIALEYIRDAIERGNTSDDIRQTLEYLASEGRNIQARENGRLVNNFPDVRWRAAEYLGQLGTEEARQTLMKICYNFDGEEPLVIRNAITALGNIGANENNDAIRSIIGAGRHYHNTNPTDGLALAVIHAVEQLARKNDGLNYSEAIRLLGDISSDGRYSSATRERARQSLAELRSYGSSGGN